MKARAGLASLVWMSMTSLAWASPPDAAMPFPADAGAVSIKDFGAVGDGEHDDTSAFVAALASTADRAELWHVRIVQVPAGTYRVTGTITKHQANGGYDSGFVLIGAGRDRTVIRLADHSAGFADAGHPRAVIYTSGKGVAQAPKNGYAMRGEGNDAFSNFIEDLSVNTGEDNPGAIGIDYLASNQGALRNVLVKGSGLTGIAMTRAWFGPGLIDHVTVDGFDVGIDVGSLNASVTMDSVLLSGQRRVGLRNADNLVAAHELSVRATRNLREAAIVNATPAGMIVIDGGSIESGGAEPISNHGLLTLRGLKSPGVSGFLAHAMTEGVIDGVFQGESRLSAAAPPWALRGEPEPEPKPDPPSAWVSVASFLPPQERAAGAGVDATAAFRAAFASGSATIYVPFGIYVIRANLTVPAAVQRIVGMNSTILWTPAGGNRAADDPARGLFVTGANREPLRIEKLVFSCPAGHHVAVEQVSAGTLVLHDIVGMGAVFERAAAGGPLFLSNVSGGFLLRVAGGAPVWGRQVDSEGGGARGGSGSIRILNAGAPMWLLGLKSEGDNTLVAATNGATTDVVGTLFASLAGASRPLFEATDSRLDATGVEVAWKPGAAYRTILHATRGSRDETIPAERFPARPQTQGVFVPRVITEDSSD